MDSWRNQQARLLLGGSFVIIVGMQVIFAFSAHIGACSVVAVELWVILIGIQIAWNRGSKKLIVESDYLISISLLMHECPTFHNCFSLIHNIHEFVLDRGEVQWSHTLREGNQVADIFCC